MPREKKEWMNRTLDSPKQIVGSVDKEKEKGQEIRAYESCDLHQELHGECFGDLSMEI